MISANEGKQDKRGVGKVEEIYRRVRDIYIYEGCLHTSRTILACLSEREKRKDRTSPYCAKKGTIHYNSFYSQAHAENV
jgi:hypothetical protein